MLKLLRHSFFAFSKPKILKLHFPDEPYFKLLHVKNENNKIIHSFSNIRDLSIYLQTVNCVQVCSTLSICKCNIKKTGFDSKQKFNYDKLLIIDTLKDR